MEENTEEKEKFENMEDKLKKMYAPNTEDSPHLTTIKKELSTILDQPFHDKLSLSEIQKLKEEYNRLHSFNQSKQENITLLQNLCKQLEAERIDEATKYSFPSYRELNKPEANLISDDALSEIMRNRKNSKSQSTINKPIATGFPSIDELANQLEGKKKEIYDAEQQLQNELHYTEIYQNNYKP